MPITSFSRDTLGVVKLVGNFDFHAHREFRTACELLLADPQIRMIQIDFAEVPYLDSSALGMLLLLKEKTTASEKLLELINVKATVKQVLEIACFGKLFTIR